METRVRIVSPSAPSADAIREAAEALERGEMVVFPTETVYGLAVRSDDPAARARLVALKGRDGDKPLTVHLPSVDRIGPPWFAVAAPSGAAKRLARAFLPGPLTLVLSDRTGGTLGFRVPDDAVARAVLLACEFPVVATSVNEAGRPPAVTGAEAARFAGGHAAVLLDAGPTRLRGPSTVVRVLGDDRVEVLREGVIPEAEIRKALQ